MKIIEEYRFVIESIAVVKSKLITAERGLKKNIEIYKPVDVKGVNYSNEKIQVSTYQQNILTTANNIYQFSNTITKLKEELEELYKQKEELEKTIIELGDIKKQILMYRIKGLTIGKIAYKLNYSKRHIERLISQIKKDVGEMSV